MIITKVRPIVIPNANIDYTHGVMINVIYLILITFTFLLLYDF